jgi:hypothetical protein
MKSFFSFIIVTLVVFSFVAVPVFHIQAATATNSTGNYTPLAPLPGTGVNGNDSSVNLQSYIPGIIKLIIGIAGALAVIMIVIGGVQYLSTDAIGGKSEGKEKITNALIGLLLAIGAFVILNTINPGTLQLNLNLKPVALGGGAPPPAPPPGVPPVGPPAPPTPTTCPFYDSATKATTYVSCSCPNCVNIATTGTYASLPLKPGQGQYLNPQLADKLLVFNQLMQQANLNWQITEVWPPVPPGHSSQCHLNGTCIDANLIPQAAPTIPVSQADAINVTKFFQIANQAGFSSLQLEVGGKSGTQANVNAFYTAGVPQGDKIVTTPGNGTGNSSFHINF